MKKFSTKDMGSVHDTVQSIACEYCHKCSDLARVSVRGGDAIGMLNEDILDKGNPIWQCPHCLLWSDDQEQE